MPSAGGFQAPSGKEGASALDGVGPTLQEPAQIGWRFEPQFGSRLTPLFAHEQRQATLAKALDAAEGGLVTEVVSGIDDGSAIIGLGQDGIDGPALVAPHAQLDAAFKIKEFEAFEACQWFKQSTGTALDLCCFFARIPTPMHDGTVGFVFKQAAKAVCLELLAQLFECLFGGGRCLFELTTAIAVETLSAMQPPDFDGRGQIEHGRNLSCWTAGDDCNACVPLLLDAGKSRAYAGPGLRLKAIDAKGGEGAVVIEQEVGPAVCESCEKLVHTPVQICFQSRTLLSYQFTGQRGCGSDALFCRQPGTAQTETMPTLDKTAKRIVASVQDYTLFSWQALANLWRPPVYWDDFMLQADIIGVGSAAIVVLVGFFTGGVLALQSAQTLAQFGATAVTGRFVSLSMIRELGPVLSGVMVSGRNASSMASELGSMVVTEQIDAMRALGVDPMRKLVTPRLYSSIAMVFFLTIVADALGTLGGAAVTVVLNHQNGTQYLSEAYEFLKFPDILQGLFKPLVFGFIIASIGCFRGLRTTGGTEGVGKSTISAVVTSSVLIVVSDFLISQLMLSLF